jgi:hypothetical protein
MEAEQPEKKVENKPQQKKGEPNKGAVTPKKEVPKKEGNKGGAQPVKNKEKAKLVVNLADYPRPPFWEHRVAVWDQVKERVVKESAADGTTMQSRIDLSLA